MYTKTLQLENDRRLEFLPPELWEEIGKRLDNLLDVNRFRSTCTSWRSILPTPTSPSLFPLRVPSPSDKFFLDEEKYRFYITQNTVYLFKPTSGKDPFIVVFHSRVPTDNSRGGSNLFCPNSLYSEENGFRKLYEFPPVLDMLQSSFTALYTTYSIRLNMKFSRELSYTSFVDKTVLIAYDSNSECPTMVNHNHLSIKDKVTVLAVVALMQTSKLNFLNTRSMKWKPITCDNVTDSEFYDIINYRNVLWALGKDGGAYVMDFMSQAMTLVVRPPEHIIDAGRKRLVEASDGLYMLVPSVSLIRKILKNIKVFKLKGRKWVQVKSIGNQVFYVMQGLSFSTTAGTNLCFARYGNCILLDGCSFSRHSYRDPQMPDYPSFREFRIRKEEHIGVYNLGDVDVPPSFKMLCDKRDLPEIFCPNFNIPSKKNFITTNTKVYATKQALIFP